MRTLPAYGNLFSDLRLTARGYGLCVTLNSRDVRCYVTDFSQATKGGKPFVAWLHFSHAAHLNLFQNDIAHYYCLRKGLPFFIWRFMCVWCALGT